MLWAYMGFGQFLMIWAENLPDEIPWFLRLHHALGVHGIRPVPHHLGRESARRDTVVPPPSPCFGRTWDSASSSSSGQRICPTRYRGSSPSPCFGRTWDSASSSSSGQRICPTRYRG